MVPGYRRRRVRPPRRKQHCCAYAASTRIEHADPGCRADRSRPYHHRAASRKIERPTAPLGDTSEEVQAKPPANTSQTRRRVHADRKAATSLARSEHRLNTTIIETEPTMPADTAHMATLAIDELAALAAEIELLTGPGQRHDPATAEQLKRSANALA